MTGKNGSTPHEQGDSGRDEKGRFLPGVSGNPGGRPPKPMFLNVLAEIASEDKTTVDAIYKGKVRRLLELVDQTEDPKLALQAIIELFNRGFGAVEKAAVSIDVDARSVTMVQQIPQGEDARKWMRRFMEAAQEQGLLGDGDDEPSGS